MKEPTEPIRFFHHLLWPNPDELPGRPMAVSLQYDTAGLGGKKLEFLRDGLNSRVVNDLKKRSAIGIYFYFVVIGVVIFTDQYYVRHPDFSMKFCLSVAGICFFRLAHRIVFRMSRPELEKINIVVFLLSVALTGVIWGVGFAVFMVQDGEPNAKMLMVMCTTGLCAGGVVAYIPYLRLSLAFCFSMLVPAILTMGVFQTNFSLVAVIFFFLLYMSVMAVNGNREYWDALEKECLLKEKSRDLEMMSRIDGLTGLYNRRYFDESFCLEWNRSVRNQSPVSIILCDIDHFKQVNDRHGHPAGDDYLRQVALLLKTVFRRKTDIVARYGGEEFIILMPDESLENTCRLAEIMRSATQKLHMEYQGETIHKTLSLGVAVLIPRKEDKMESLISMADSALYQSKKMGRNRVSHHN
jgi:diguanylate cyclase (GGDEF)-like protein